MENEDLASYCNRVCHLSINELSLRSTVPRRTLYDWWNTKRKVVELIIQGIAMEQQAAKQTEAEVTVAKIIKMVNEYQLSVLGKSTKRSNHGHLS